MKTETLPQSLCLLASQIEGCELYRGTTLVSVYNPDHETRYAESEDSSVATLEWRRDGSLFVNPCYGRTEEIVVVNQADVKATLDAFADLPFADIVLPWFRSIRPPFTSSSSDGLGAGAGA